MSVRRDPAGGLPVMRKSRGLPVENALAETSLILSNATGNDNARMARKNQSRRRRCRRSVTGHPISSSDRASTKEFGWVEFSARTCTVAGTGSERDCRCYSMRVQVCSLQSTQTQPLTSRVVASTSSISES